MSSSVFSFRALRLRLPVSPALLLAIGILLALRVGIAVMNAHGFYSPRAPEAILYASMELSHRLREQEAPAVVVMGSSRLINVREACLSGALGLREHEVRNFSQLAPSLWRNALLVRRNPEILRDVKILLIDITPMHLLSEHMVEGETFLRMASVRERLEVRDATDRLRALADFLVPAWSERRSAGEWIDAFRFLSMNERQREHLLRKRVDERVRTIFAFGAILNYRPGDDIHVARFMWPDSPSSRLNDMALEFLVSQLPDDALLLLVTLPTIGEVKRRMEEDDVAQGVEHRFQERLEQVRNPRVRVLRSRDADELGLERADYHKDGVHFSERGNRKLCTLIAEMIRGATTVGQGS